MIKFEIDESRNQLGFKDEILKNFIFLINDYGYRCVRTEITFVRYESDKVFINIYHGRGSYELGFEIGYISKDKSKEVHYTLTEIMKLYNAKEYIPFQITTKEVMIKLVPKMAELVKQYAIKAIIGDKDFYKKLGEMNNKWFKNYMINQDLSKAEEAWEKKNYRKFIEILYPHRNKLNGTIKRKYDYAFKKFGT